MLFHNDKSKLIDVTKNLTFIIRIFSICISTVIVALSAPFILPVLNSLSGIGNVHICQTLTKLLYFVLESIDNSDKLLKI